MKPAPEKPGRKEGSKKEGPRSLAVNRRASHDYFLYDRFEAGLLLTGTEVKSLRAGNANLKDAYVVLKEGEAWLFNCHISAWPFAAGDNHDPERTRKLLLHGEELRKIESRIKQKGYTIVPTRIYASGRYLKCEIALAKGKKEYDKRETERRRTVEKETRQAIRDRSGR